MGCARGLIDETLGEIAVSVYPPVTEEGPMGAGDVHLGEVNLHEHHLLFLDRGFGEKLPGRAGDETLARVSSPARPGSFSPKPRSRKRR